MKRIIKMITAFTAAICLTVNAFAANPVTGGDYVGTLESTAYSHNIQRDSLLELKIQMKALTRFLLD